MTFELSPRGWETSTVSYDEMPYVTSHKSGTCVTFSKMIISPIKYFIRFKVTPTQENGKI